MDERLIGDVSVGSLGIGGASWSLTPVRDDRASEALLRAALDLGVSYVDTAAAYTSAEEASHNELLIARVLRSGSWNVVVGTKGGHYRDGDHWPVDGRPSAIKANCEASLRALGVGELDLYYLHKPDPLVPFEESVAAIEALRVEGKTKRTGLANVSYEQLQAALAVSPISAIQNEFSPFRRDDLSLIEFCAAQSIAYVAFSPLGGQAKRGLLPGLLPRTSQLSRQRRLSIASTVLAWELSVSPSVIPLTGAGRLSTLRDSLSADAIEWDAEFDIAMTSDLSLLDAASAVP